MGRKNLPKKMPDYISPGNKDEAVAYVFNALDAWRAASGSIKWIEKNLA